ncbi:hypothetical protein HY468_01260 [Candidatus Roizmanbacteria bacterium]|nr:hypothetical protein [Candidatus Roizmanbacteria bacterium]
METREIPDNRPEMEQPKPSIVVYNGLELIAEDAPEEIRAVKDRINELIGGNVPDAGATVDFVRQTVEAPVHYANLYYCAQRGDRIVGVMAVSNVTQAPFETIQNQSGILNLHDEGFDPASDIQDIPAYLFTAILRDSPKQLQALHPERAEAYANPVFMFETDKTDFLLAFLQAGYETHADFTSNDAKLLCQRKRMSMVVEEPGTPAIVDLFFREGQAAPYEVTTRVQQETGIQAFPHRQNVDTIYQAAFPTSGNANTFAKQLVRQLQQIGNSAKKYDAEAGDFIGLNLREYNKHIRTMQRALTTVFGEGITQMQPGHSQEEALTALLHGPIELPHTQIIRAAYQMNYTHLSDQPLSDIVQE